MRLAWGDRMTEDTRSQSGNGGEGTRNPERGMGSQFVNCQ